MKRNRRNQGSGLAFLDVMSCGLGAVLLLFLIIKHNTNAAQIPDVGQVLPDETVLEDLIEQKQGLESSIETILEQVRERQENDKAQMQFQQEQDSKQQSLNELLDKIQTQQKKKRSLELEIAALQPRQAADVIEQPHVGEEHYLIGMTVKGRRIAVMLDQSASMTDVKLIDIVTRKFKSDPEKQAGPKWGRTKRVAKWLLNRLPQSSEFVVVAFNEDAQLFASGQWTSGRDEQQLNKAFDWIERLVPSGATNLDAGLRALSSLPAFPTDVYVVTDGLPTMSQGRSVRGCRKSANIVTGECRFRIFEVSVNRFSGATVNTILLPLEGDPEAAPAYWAWSARTGGLLMSPSADWP